MKQLRLSADLSLPADAVTQRLGFLGTVGSGKSYTASKLAELMLDAGGQIIAIDPVGIWYGLRLAANGKPSKYQIPIFGGLHGDVHLEATSGKLIADLVVDRAISVVLDISQFESDADKARFCEAFGNRFFFRKKAKRSAVHLFLEECQEVLPQNPQRGEEKMLHAFTRIDKLGRNFGIGLSLITQRPQEVNKKALNLTECLFAFQTNGKHERKAIEEWITDKGIDVDIAAILPKLETGHAHVWSPRWLKVSKEVMALPKTTADVSATPLVGADVDEAKPLAPIDLEQLRATMAASIEKAKAEDPKELQKEIARLKGELNRAHKSSKELAPDPAVVAQRVKVGIAAGVAESMRSEWKRVRGAVKHIGDAEYALAALEKHHGVARTAIAEGLKAAKNYLEKEEQPAPAAVPTLPARHAWRVATPDRAVIPSGARVSHVAKGESNLSAGEQRVLNALAELKAMHVETPTRPQAGAMARYDLTGGSGSGYVASLVAAGYVELPGSGKLQLTAAGEAIAAPPPEFISDEELHNRALSYLKAGEAKILRRLLELYPEPTSRAELGTDVGYDLTGGSGSGYVAKLVRLGFAELPGSGRIVASSLMFPSQR